MTLALPLIVATLLADGPAPASAAKVAYYLGESKVRNADGKPLGNLVALVKRELRPGEARIVESTLLLSSRGGEPVQEHVAVSSVKGETFTVKDQKGAFSGDGTLSGPAWAWTSWTSNTTLGGGSGTLRARSQITERGMAVDKALLAPNGAIRVTFAEDYAAIDSATYELLRAKLLPAEGPR
ncbi:MAG TPA: hypothetical protein VGH33_16570 [Isosphaeraceae bacterium]|jgi:hypothetical protein